jgi:hypothetical protein
MSVQEFFDALPRPFVEPIDDGKIASDVQWANMLNMIIQGAKMHDLKTMFYFTDTETRTGELLTLLSCKDIDKLYQA